MAALDYGADKIRINQEIFMIIAQLERVVGLQRKKGGHSHGVNAGSLEKDLWAKYMALQLQKPWWNQPCVGKLL